MQDHRDNGESSWANDACRNFDAQLRDYLEGEGGPAVPAHAAECVFCGAVLADVLLVRSASRELDGEDPPPRVWARVKTALVEEGLIRPRRERRRWLEWFLRPIPAAAFTAALLLSVFVVRSWIHSHHQAAMTAVTVFVDPNFAKSVSEMETAFRAQSVNLNPSIKLAYERDLESLNSEISECNTSLVHQPDDALSREYLNSAYTEKARVLESALELGDSDGR